MRLQCITEIKCDAIKSIHSFIELLLIAQIIANKWFVGFYSCRLYIALNWYAHIAWVLWERVCARSIWLLLEKSKNWHKITKFPLAVIKRQNHNNIIDFRLNLRGNYKTRMWKNHGDQWHAPFNQVKKTYTAILLEDLLVFKLTYDLWVINDDLLLRKPTTIQWSLSTEATRKKKQQIEKQLCNSNEIGR